MRKIAVYAAILAMLLCFVGCAKTPNVTPQYQAAVDTNKFSVALKDLQATEISLYASGTGVVPKDLHLTIQSTFLQVALLGKQMDTAIAANDFTSAKSYINSAIGLIGALDPSLVGIKDANSQALMRASILAFTNSLKAWVGTFPVASLEYPRLEAAYDYC